MKMKLSILAALLLALLCAAASGEMYSYDEATGEATGTDLQAEATETELEGSHTLTISFVGDCTVGEAYEHRGYRSGYIYKLNQHGWDYPFSNVADMFAWDDLTVANCEGVFTTRRARKQQMALGADPKYAEVFKLGNVDMVNIFNNHTLDFGAAGRKDTRAALDAQGILWSDLNIPVTTTVKGIKIGMLSVCWPIRKTQLENAFETIRQLKEEQGCDLVIVSAHWGKEDNYKVQGDQLKATRFLDAGADIIFGTGSHTLQPIQYYKGKIIMYSMCNFTFGGNGGPKDSDTAVVQLRFNINDDGSLTASYLTAYPFKQHKDGDFRPWQLTDQKQRETCLAKLWTDGNGQKVKSNLPESFKTTGEVDLIAWQRELDGLPPVEEPVVDETEDDDDIPEDEIDEGGYDENDEEWNEDYVEPDEYGGISAWELTEEDEEETSYWQRDDDSFVPDDEEDEDDADDDEPYREGISTVGGEE